jgi:FkbM family methyltransferase
MLNRKIKKKFWKLINFEPEKKIKNNEIAITQYNAAVLALASVKQKLTITVVGANDGKIKDPIFPLVERRLRKQVKMILIEPQSFLIDRIKENYALLEDVHVFNVAIGDKPSLKMYRIKEQFWDQVASGSKRAWPNYRLASGATSLQKEHVVEWARKKITSVLDVNDVIAELDVPGCRLGQLLAANHLPMEIDVLQVDAEGEDDSVIYCCDLELTRPRILFFESKNLAELRLASLLSYLDELGYEVFRLRKDTLAIHIAG